MSKVYKNVVGGKEVEASTKKTFENRNPADWNELVGLFPQSTKEDVVKAIEVAKNAYQTWRKVPIPKRAEIMRKTGEILEKRKEEIARLMTREMGKVLKETRGDVQEGIDTAFYAAGEGRRFFGRTVPSELPNKVCFTLREPMGVWGIITPWNFPMAIPTWKIFPALLGGNTVVFKPASDTPATGGELVRAFHDAGLPPGVLNIIYGGGGEVGETLLAHPDIVGISFTGSSLIGKRIGEMTGKLLKRCSLELGGKNGQIVLEDADLDLAIEGALWGAFGTTGQRCTATSRLIVHQAIYDRFNGMLKARAEKISVGNGLDEKNEMGPLINAKQREIVHSYTEIGQGEGAKLLTGGESYKEGECAKGWFYRPTVFIDVKADMRIAQEEIFGPILSVFKARDLDEALSILNGTIYGLSSSIYTRDLNRAYKAIEEIEAGITYVNAPTIGAECHLPFGGVKETGNGHREGGWTAYEIFTELKTVYIDYSRTLQKAQIDTWDTK